MAPSFAPKQRVLSSSETSSSFEIWKENLLFNLTVDGSYEDFLEDGFTWQPTSVHHRGFTDDDASLPNRRTAKQKAAMLQLMLGSIASYAPVISRQSIVTDALCLNDIWTRLRTHFGFRKTGALILDLPSFTLSSEGGGESYESLWERLSAFIRDNLLSPDDNIKHLGQQPATENLTPTLLNVTVVLWLRAIHPGLPNLVRQKYATELRNNTIASLREEISESLDALVAELSSDNVSVLRSYSNYKKPPPVQRRPPTRSCALCIEAKRPSDHFLSECPFLPESDRRFLQSRRGPRTRGVDVDEYDDFEDQYAGACAVSTTRRSTLSNEKPARVKRVDVMKSPVIYAKFDEHTVPLTLDSGAEADIMKRSCAERIGVKIYPTKTSASQADGCSDLKIVGEVHCQFKRGDHSLTFNGLVSEELSDDVICGVPFQYTNDIYARPSARCVYIGDESIPYDDEELKGKPVNRTCKVRGVILRSPRQTVLMPDESFCVPVPEELNDDSVSIEPRLDAPSITSVKSTSQWLQPHVNSAQEGVVELKNTSKFPVLIRRHEQIAVVRPVTACDTVSSPDIPKIIKPVKPEETLDYKSVSVDPGGQLTKAQRDQFHSLHREFKDVFDSRTLGCYNGNSGDLEININMGPTLPPQRKGRMPMYSRSMQEELQRICDELEGTVLLRPEVAGVPVEYLNLSFLVSKPSGKKRYVTSFGEVGQYAKPQPALMPDTNQILRHIGNWRYLLKTDLTSAYWQMKLAKASMKYCGVVTPFRGVRVYARGAMGMPGTETALEELMCRILDDLLLEGNVIKIADDLYVGGNTPEEVLKTWKEVLIALQHNGLKLSATKTECCPTSVTILGWVWSQGMLKASPHKSSALAAVELPVTVGLKAEKLSGWL